ncbi:oligosaccharide flippase family protein [bacterium]|nr:oligosaccharide flippase family protein [bacterium]
MPPTADNRQAFYLRSSVLLTGAYLLVSLGNYGFQALMGRLLPLSEFGYLSAALGLIGMIGIGVTGAGLAVTHYLARHQARSDAAAVARLQTASSVFLLYLTIASCVLAVVLIKPLTDFFHVPRATITGVVLACIVVTLWGALANAWCAGLSQFIFLAGLTLGGVAVRLVAGALAGARWPQAEAGIAASIAGGLVVVLGVLIRDARSLRLGGSPRPILEREFLQFLAAALAVAAGNYLFTQSDLLVAQRYLGPDALGAYGAAGLLSRAVVYLATPVLMVFFTARSGQDSSDRTSRTQLALYGLLLVVGAAGVILTRDLLCRLLLGRLEPAAVTLMARFAVAMLPIGVLQGIGFYVLAARRRRLCLVYGGCGLIYVLALIAWGHSADALLRLMPSLAGASVLTLGVLLAVAAVRNRFR